MPNTDIGCAVEEYKTVRIASSLDGEVSTTSI